MNQKDLLSNVEMAQQLGITTSQIKNYLDKGAPHEIIGNKKYFDPNKLQVWLDQNLHRPNEDERSAKIRKLSAEASLKELQLQKAKGEVISSEAAIELIKDEYAKIRTKLLSVGALIAPHLYDPNLLVRQNIVDDAIREALAELTIDTKTPQELADTVTDEDEWIIPDS